MSFQRRLYANHYSLILQTYPSDSPSEPCKQCSKGISGQSLCREYRQAIDAQNLRCCTAHPKFLDYCSWLLNSGCSKGGQRREVLQFYTWMICYYNQSCQLMNLDSILQQEPLQKLVPCYIQLEVRESDSKVRERAMKEVSLLNSILIALASHKQGLKALLTEVKYSLEVNENDRKCMERAAILMSEVIKRSQHLLVKSTNQVIMDIVELACEKAFIALCGNSFISLLNQVSLILDLSHFKQVAQRIINFLINPKLLVATYRQQTRLCLYKLYLRILNIYPSIISVQAIETSKQRNIIERCISGGNGQKDPRNIGSVFELYLKLLDLFPEEKLVQHRTIMFQNLQSYYPIEFVGDQDNQQHQKINLREISSLLDQCLTHPFFRQQTWQLFSNKTAAPPIAPFVPTFLLYLSRRRLHSDNGLLVGRLKNMLTRLSEDEFIGEDYPDGEPDLGNVFVAILDIIFCRADGTYTLSAYETVMGYFQKMIDKVVRGPCKNSGALMGIFRCLVKQSYLSRFKVLVELFRNYSLRRVLKVLQNQQDIIPKLGLAIVSLSEIGYVSSELQEIVALLVLQVGKLYSEVTDQIKMLLLKILLEAYKGYPQNRLMVRTTNDSFILKDCLSRAKWAFENSPDPTQAYLVKAFIDFISSVYFNKLEAILENIEGANFELETYLIGRLLQVLSKEQISEEILSKKKLILSKFNILISSLKSQADKQGIANALKVIDPLSCFELVSQADWKNNKQSALFVIKLIIQLKNRYQNSLDSDEEGKDICGSEKSKKIWAYINGRRIGYGTSTTMQQIWTQFSSDSALMFPHLAELHKFDLKEYKYMSCLRQAYEPTLVPWLWQHLNAIQSEQIREKQACELLECLPEKLLLRDSERILQILIKSERQGSSLLKIVKHLQVATLNQTGIIQHCLSYIQEMYDKPEETKSIQRSVCIFAVIICVLQKDRTGELKKQLLKVKKHLKKLMLHRKRPIRQATRKIIMLLQE